MSIGKIFLCHSSIDKGYVDHVASKLGRARVAYDKLCFQPGQDFRAEIQRLMGESILFVFFASKASVASYWCKYEIAAAEKLRIQGKLEGAIAIIIDHELEYSQLPAWMADLKASRIPSPNAATRVIEASLFALTPVEQHRTYVIRTALLERLQSSVASGESLRMITLAGLDGIGKKSFLEFATRTVFGMQFGPVIRVDETQSLEDVYLFLVDETSHVESTEMLAEEVKLFRTLPLESKCAEVAAKLAMLSELNHFPCFIDAGGLLDEGGNYKEEWRRLFELYLGKEISHFGIAHRRKPVLDAATNLDRFAFFQFVNPLSVAESQLLLTQLLRKNKVHMEPHEIKEIVEGLGGYPPAIQLTANFIVEYGIEVLRNQSYILTDFTSRRFMPFIKSLALSDDERMVMQYLASERPLTLDVVSIALNITPEATAAAFRRLIDLNVIVNDEGRYSVAGPLRDAIVRVRGILSDDRYAEICGRLTNEFWARREEFASPSIDAIDATLHAALMGKRGSDHPYEEFVRASTVHRIALDAYYQKKFDMTEEYAKRALQMEPDRLAAEVLLVKALIQREKYDEAEAHLNHIGANWRKWEYYLRGFMAKKRYQFKKAIDFFEKAIAAGDDSISVHRDLADCLYRGGRLSDAVQRVEKARRKGRDNAFVLDLAVRIYIDAGDTKEAAACLGELEKCDVQQRFIHHCKARILAAKGDYNLALSAANQACELPSQPLEVFAKRIDILMHLKKMDAAWEELESLPERFPHHRRDVVNGLRCKFFAIKGDWRQARMHWEDIKDKDSDVYQGILRMILEVKSGDATLSLAEREKAKQEMELVAFNLPPDVSIVAAESEMD